MAQAAWRTFLEQVDESPPDESVLVASEKFLFEVAKLLGPKAADGVSMAKLEAVDNFPSSLAVQAFLSRTVRCIDAVASAEQAVRNSCISASVSPGTAASAKQIADSLSPVRSADTAKYLKEAAMEKLPFVAQLEQSLVDKMHAEKIEARTSNRKPFLYVELTSKEVIPVWLTPESIGGKFHGEDLCLQGAERISNLAQLGQALKGATDSQRCFRSFPQWSAAYWRWAPIWRWQLATGPGLQRCSTTTTPPSSASRNVQRAKAHPWHCCTTKCPDARLPLVPLKAILTLRF